MKNWLLYLVFVAVVLAFFFSISGTRAPRIPLDGAHNGIQVEAVCRDCHAPGKEAPLKKEHPPKEMCFKCHTRKKQK